MFASVGSEVTCILGVKAALFPYATTIYRLSNTVHVLTCIVPNCNKTTLVVTETTASSLNSDKTLVVTETTASSLNSDKTLVVTETTASSLNSDKT